MATAAEQCKPLWTPGTERHTVHHKGPQSCAKGKSQEPCSKSQSTCERKNSHNEARLVRNRRGGRARPVQQFGCSFSRVTSAKDKATCGIHHLLDARGSRVAVRPDDDHRGDSGRRQQIFTA